MCAGTVVEPLGPTSAAIASVTSRSRSVALQPSFELSALISTLARIGMVLRRSTTRWTWPSDFSSAARSMVTFMANTTPRGSPTWRGGAVFARVERMEPQVFPAIHGSSASERSLLQLPLQDLDFVGQHGVIAHQSFDLADRMQHGGVVTSAKPAADLGQRTQGQRLSQIHRHLPRPDHVGGAARRQQVGAADIVLARDDALNVLDLDALGFLRTDQVAHLALGHFHRDRLTGQFVMRKQAVDGAIEIATGGSDRFLNIGEHRCRNVEARMILSRRQDARLE